MRAFSFKSNEERKKKWLASGELSFAPGAGWWWMVQAVNGQLWDIRVISSGLILVVGNTFTVVRAHIGIQSIHGHEAEGRKNIFWGKSINNHCLCWTCFHIVTWELGVSQSVRNENTGHPELIIIWICDLSPDLKSHTCLSKWPGRRQSLLVWGQFWHDRKEHKHVWMILFQTKIYMKLWNIHLMVWQEEREQ